MPNCRLCGAAIFFNGRIKSKYGKLIPMSCATNGRHFCAGGKNKDTDSGWLFQQRRRERFGAEEKKRRDAVLDWMSKQRTRTEEKRRKEQERVRQLSIDKLQQQRHEHDLGCEILGIPIDSTDEVKKMAYRDRMMQFHPDRYHGDKEVAHRLAVKINWAYEHSVNVMLNVKR